MQSPLTEEEKSLAKPFMDLTDQALVRCRLDGHDVAALCTIIYDEGMYNIQPIAIIVTDEMFRRMEQPD